MNLSGTTIINATRTSVWDFLTSPDRVSGCVPGLESMTIVIPDKQFQAVAAIGFGSIRARFTTDVEWLELSPPGKARMKAHGTAPGSAVDVIAELDLVAMEDGATKLGWSAEVSIVGSIASLANRMMGSVAEKISAQFFDCVRKYLESPKNQTDK